MASAKRKKRMASQKTDLHSVKKNVPHNEEIEHRTLNKDLDHKKNEIEKIYLKFPGMLKEEVTWTAVAAIGGAAIVFWNVIKYIIILYNSFMLYGKTNVPMYLLVMRRNISFSSETSARMLCHIGFSFFATRQSYTFRLCCRRPPSQERWKRVDAGAL